MSADIAAITMPKWGLAMEEGMVVAWHAEPGRAIEAGEDLVDIETTKITNVFEAPVSGLLRRRVVEEGEIVPVGALLGVVAEEAVAEGDIDVFIERFNEAFEVKAREEGEAAPEPRTIEAGGFLLNFLEAGGGADPPIVLVHGFGGDLNNWLFNVPALAEAHRLYALDLPGHGRSGKDVGNGSLASLAAAVLAFLDALEIDRAHLVGHSLGGAVALELALRKPERAVSLTLVSPAGLGTEVSADYIEGFIDAGRRKEMKAVLQMLFADPDLVSRDMVDDVLKYKRLDGVEDALRKVAGAVFPDGRQSEVLAARLGELSQPIQLVWGEEDRIVPVAHADDLPGSIAVHRLPGIGHMAHMEAAGEVNRLIAEIAA